MNNDAEKLESMTDLTAVSPNSLAYLRRLGRRDKSIGDIVAELQALLRLFDSAEARADAEVRAGLRAAADRAMLGLAAIPAATLDELHLKILACGSGRALNARREYATTMLEVTIVADINRLEPDGSQCWLRPWL